MPPRGRRLALSTAALALAVFAGAAWLSWPHLRFWWLFEPLGMNAQGLPEYRHRQTGIVMVRVPGGTFWMGAQREDPSGPNYDPDANEWDGPVHEVELSPFLIGKYETSQAEWKQVMGPTSNDSLFRGEDLPVGVVTWDDCQEFCRKTELRLPTEAQWEFAYLAGRKTPFALGKTITPERLAYDEAPHHSAVAETSNREKKTVAVDSSEPNGVGLYHMQGNVSEWCQDDSDGLLGRKAVAYEKDPVCASGSAYKIHRGNDWEFDDPDGRLPFRWQARQDEGDCFTGFRVAFYPLP